MITITEQFIEAAAPNIDAAKNGRGLVLKNKFSALNRSPDDTLLFGFCKGSGKLPYLCSADFAAPDSAVYRCTCPSRQFPCKHALGLMYAYVQSKPFTIAEVPEELTAKREKAAARVEVKRVAAEKPKTTNKAALAKKIKAQLKGIDLLEKLTLDLVRLGIGNMNAKTADEVEQQAKQLGNVYLPGAQTALRNFTKLFTATNGGARPTANSEAIYSEALDQLSRLHALVRQGRDYLQRRLEDPALAPETDSSIAAWLGHAWQLRELKDAGLVAHDVELMQLAFNTQDDVARKEYVDTGIWMNFASGQIQITQTFRPYKAVKYIKSDDSFFDVAQISELCIYPGDINPRVRWEAMLSRAPEATDFARIRGHGHSNFAQKIKEVKSHLKNPLADKQPIAALNYQQIGKVGGVFVVEDHQGERLVLTDASMDDTPSTCQLLSLLPPSMLADQTLIVRFHHDLDTRKLQVKPLSVVTDTTVIRLTF